MVHIMESVVEKAGKNYTKILPLTLIWLLFRNFTEET